MILKELTLVNFKNYEEEKFRFSHRLITISGDNGMGKTNALDAIYFLAMGKSYFVGSDRNLIHTDQEFFRVDAKLEEGDEKYHLVIKNRQGQGKEIELNGVRIARLADHIGLIPVVFITPDDVHSLLSGNEERRVFVNNTLVQLNPQYLEALAVYNRNLKQRNALLKDFADRQYWDQDLLDVITDAMYAPAHFIHRVRTSLINHFNPFLQTYYQHISQGRETVSLIYSSQLDGNNFKDLSIKNGQKDKITQRTSVGIHKDEINFFMNNRPLKDFASQGQLKSFIFGLKLSQYAYLKAQTHKEPILLLDDVFDKLDQGRVERLLSLMGDTNFGQIFITDTHIGRTAQLINGEEIADHFTIAGGKITN